MMITLVPVGSVRKLSSLADGALFVTGDPMFITNETLYVKAQADNYGLGRVVQVGTGWVMTLANDTLVTAVVRSGDKSRNEIAFDQESGRA